MSVNVGLKTGAIKDVRLNAIVIWGKTYNIQNQQNDQTSPTDQIVNVQFT